MPLLIQFFSFLISTHTLTWSVTNVLLFIVNSFSISTHTLTWSVTLVLAVNLLVSGNFNSHAHVERDVGRNNKMRRTNDFNSHAHVERDT